MNKKIGALITALCMTSGMAYAVDALFNDDSKEGDLSLAQGPKPLPPYVGVDNLNPVEIEGVCAFIWKSEDQVPLPVTVIFDDGGTATKDWVAAIPAATLATIPAAMLDPGDDDAAGAITADWSLIGVHQDKNTFKMKWFLQTNKPIESIIINGLEGKRKMGGDIIATIFDIQNGPEITDGSANGYPFTYTPNAEMELEATYSHPLFVGYKPAPEDVPDTHDLYGTLRIDFIGGFIGTVDLGSILNFRADTDCVMEADLDSFSAEVRSEQVQVKWTTLSERGTDGFEVMKGQETVCSMPSLGDEGHGETYVCIDSNGSAGDRYTLVEIETDGKVAPLASERAQ